MPNYMLWSMWGRVPALPKLFLLILAVVGIHTLYLATIILVRLRSLTNHVKDDSSVRRLVAALQNRSANMRQLITAAFYLFGLAFFIALPSAFSLLALTKIPGVTLILENLQVHFAVAANAFFVFLVLHSIQWFVSSRVYAYALRLNPQDIA